MATEQDDSEIPESGAVFTFGKSRFAENQPNKFWIRNDEVVQVTCGDEHTVLLAESGRVFVFGDNSYGQLGLGHTKPVNKPTCIKELKGEDVSIIGCGKSHTLIGTATGKLFSFGNNSDKQCGVDDEQTVQTPTEVDLKYEVIFKQLCGGSNHSVALDKQGQVYVWGDNSEGQLGLGDRVHEVDTPTRLESIEERVVRVACGYYHTALVTESGKLYTFGEVDDGKLGLGEGEHANEPKQVSIKSKVTWVSCGGKHTAAVTAAGAVYVFGDGQSGQLGLGTNVLESSSPTQVMSLKDIKIRYTACGENFTAAISDKGQLYTFGDGRHGKLALGAEASSNQFRPFRVQRFSKFEVTQVSCGGCHTIALAHKRDGSDIDEEVLDPLDASIANSLRLSHDGSLGASARDRRRAKEPAQELTRTLPPLTATGRSLPPLNSTLPTLSSGKPDARLKPINAPGLPSSLDKRKLPDAKFSRDVENEESDEDSDVSVTPDESEEEETITDKRQRMKAQSAKLSNGKTPPHPAKRELPKPNSRVQKEESEEDEEDEDEDSEDEEDEETEKKKLYEDKKGNLKRVEKRETKLKKGKPAAESEDEESEEEDEEEQERITSKKVIEKNKKNAKKTPLDSEEDEEEDSALESEEEKTPTMKKNTKKEEKSVKPNKKNKKSADLSEEDEEEKVKVKKKTEKKKGPNIFGSGRKPNVDLDDEDSEDDEDEEEPKKGKGKDKSKSEDKKKKKDKSNDDDDDEDDNDDDGKEKEEDKKDAPPPEPEKKSRACAIL